MSETIKRLRIKPDFRHLAIAAIAGLLAIVFIVGSTIKNAYADDGNANANRKIISVYDDGVTRGFVTEAATLREALKEANVYVDENDLTEPSLDEKLVASSYEVNIYRARPVIVRDGAVETKVLTAYRTPEQIAKESKINLYAEDETELTTSTDIVRDGAGEIMSIKRAIPFTFIFYGKTIEARTQAATVGEMLAERDIKMGESDKLSTDKLSPIERGMTVKLWREGKQTVTVDEEVDFRVEKINDANRERSFREIKTPGVKGSRTVTYEIIIQDGIETSRKEISSTTNKEPVAQVEIVGAKNNYSGSLNEWLLALRTCETGGRYNANTGNGFYGAYQFMISTWDRVAPKVGRADLVGVRPDLANPADQDFMVVQNAILSSGGLATQHPGCYAKLGLSAKPPQ